MNAAAGGALIILAQVASVRTIVRSFQGEKLLGCLIKV